MKRHKEEVQYSAGHLHSHCGPVFHDDSYYCKHFIPSAQYAARCDLVAGEIKPPMWCKLYERVAKKSS